jgi:hypothetical protein
MFKTILFFFFIFGLFFFGIASWSALQKEKKIIAKNIFLYALGCATLTYATMSIIVYLF